MTILEAINQLPTSKEVLNKLGKLFWQSNLINFGLLNEFVNQEVDGVCLLKDQILDYYNHNYLRINKLLLKDLVDNNLKNSVNLDLLILGKKKPSTIFKELFKQRLILFDFI